MKNFFLKKILNDHGFTLIETLVAIAILLLAIVGPLSIASTSLNSAYYAKDQVTAFYLAQEGIEYMRFLRDTNSLNNRFPWNLGIVNSSGFPTCTKNAPCGLDPYNIFTAGNVLTPCETNCAVKFDTTSSLYRQGSAAGTLTPTNFTRAIYVDVVSFNEDKITVVVTWKTGNLKSPNNFQITENLFNWQIGTGSTGPEL